MSNMREAFEKWYNSVKGIEGEASYVSKWDTWLACQYFCKWQIEQDAKICQGMSTNHINGGSFIMNDSYSKSLISVCADLSDAIRNQEPK